MLAFTRTTIQPENSDQLSLKNVISLHAKQARACHSQFSNMNIF
jgi:hypothetical protein